MLYTVFFPAMDMFTPDGRFQQSCLACTCMCPPSNLYIEKRKMKKEKKKKKKKKTISICSPLEVCFM